MRRLAVVALFTLAIDQASKWAVVHALDLRSLGAIDVLPPYLNFRMAWNTGINFGLFPGNAQALLIGLAAAISLWVLWWVWRERLGPWPQRAAGCLVGGAVGNAIDRAIYGGVADFLNMSCCGFENPYAFNVADIAIFVGAVGLILTTGGAGTGAGGPAKGRSGRVTRRKTP